MATLLYNVWHDGQLESNAAQERRLTMNTRIVSLESKSVYHDQADTENLRLVQSQIDNLKERVAALQQDNRALLIQLQQRR